MGGRPGLTACRRGGQLRPGNPPARIAARLPPPAGLAARSACPWGYPGRACGPASGRRRHGRAGTRVAM